MVIFASELVAEEIVAVLAGVPEVSAAVTDLFNLMIVPQSAVLPVALTYMENGIYSGPQGYEETFERMRYVLRFVCEGGSTDPIKPAAEAAFLALRGRRADRDGANLAFQVAAEWPLGTRFEGGVLYRELGFFLDVHVTQGG